jgi:hypothetical protein
MRKLLLLLSILATGCGNSPTQPTANVLTITGSFPAAGTTVTLPQSYPYIIPGGLVIPPGSNHLSVNITMSVVDSVPWAQLNVYLLTGGTNDQYCGQNTPDSPTWQFLKRDWRTSVNISGFRAYRLPCDVTGFRAILHMRNNGNLTPPTASETIAEAYIPATIHLRR